MRIFLIFISIFILSLASSVNALNVDDFGINEAPSAFFHPQEFDKLVLDIVIPGSDNLSAITIKNNGNAKDRYDITKFVLWSDAGEEGFQGMGKDEKIGDFEYYSNSAYWYLSDLDLNIPEQGLRVFISVEIARGVTSGRYIQIRIPELDDVNNNGNFDIGDFGIFTESQNNGPENEAITNSNSQTLKDFTSRDDVAPVSVINSIETITAENYVITGQSRDQGGSTPAWVKIEIDGVLYDVIDTGANYSTWKYEWENITEGNHILKTQSADWLNNIETEGDSITVVVDFPDPDPDPDPDPVDPIELIKQQITEIQQQIIDLLNQLIQIYLEELSISQ